MRERGEARRGTHFGGDVEGAVGDVQVPDYEDEARRHGARLWVNLVRSRYPRCHARGLRFFNVELGGRERQGDRVDHVRCASHRLRSFEIGGLFQPIQIFGKKL